VYETNIYKADNAVIWTELLYRKRRKEDYNYA